jgi:hypothetical protein
VYREIDKGKCSRNAGHFAIGPWCRKAQQCDNLLVGIGGHQMKTLLTLVAWCLLFVLCWPVALLALVLWPLVWLVSLPLRVVGITLDAALALLRTILFLPARVLGYRSRHV